jgi:uncharacterized RDD family membrane protein YckC
MAERLAASGLGMNSGASPYVPEDDIASMGGRFLAYAVDSAVLFGFIMVFATAAFLVIFIGSDTGRDNVTDGQEWGLLAFLIATFPAWYLLNVFLVTMRGQTIGQYVMGLRVMGEEGVSLRLSRIAIYWVALHPLLFHPMLALPWVLFAYFSLAIADSELLFIVALAIALLCLVTPLVNLIFIATDPSRRAIHDRLARLRVVRL